MSDSPTILVVEDNADERSIAAAVLRHGGFDVVEAETAHIALAEIRIRRPDLILLDLQLPGMDGIEFLHRLREDPESSTIRVLVMSSFVDVYRSAIPPVEKVLEKPVRPSVLVEAVRSLILPTP